MTDLLDLAIKHKDALLKLEAGTHQLIPVTAANTSSFSPQMNHFYKDVPKLGNVAVSRHAQAQMINAGITEPAFQRVPLHPIKPDIPDGAEIVWRERDDIRLVILINPTPNVDAKLVKTVYRIKPQATARR
ncbi:MAG: hypothetical protein JSS38_11070 [Nitrospira sp.]|nr:hypothetical protein [Nitrospira sp.]